MKCFAAYTQPQHQTFNGYEGGTITLICTRDLTQKVIKTKWSGPPTGVTYFIDGAKNKDVHRGDRLSVVLNGDSNAYDLKISNMNRLEDTGNYSCLVTTTLTTNAFYFFLEVYSKYLIICFWVT